MVVSSIDIKGVSYSRIQHYIVSETSKVRLSERLKFDPLSLLALIRMLFAVLL